MRCGARLLALDGLSGGDGEQTGKVLVSWGRTLNFRFWFYYVGQIWQIW